MNNRSTRIITTLTLAAVGGTGLALGAMAPAFAHTPEVASTCEGMTVTLQNYETGGSDAKPNTLSVTIDDTLVDSPAFGSNFTQSYPFEDDTVAHHYEVVIDAVGTEYDRTFTGDSTPCKETTPPTTPPTSTPPTTPPTSTPPVTPPTDVPPATTPPAVPVDSPNPPASGGQQLAETGIDAAPIAGVAGGLALVGGIVTAVVRRRRARA